MALISNLGLIKDFTIDGIKNEQFPKLPKKEGQWLTNNCKGNFIFQVIKMKFPCLTPCFLLSKKLSQIRKKIVYETIFYLYFELNVCM